eukprot:jgi/Chrzof1/1973/Cz10g28140.t1
MQFFSNLERQLDELDALTAVFPEPGCISYAAAELEAIQAAKSVIQNPDTAHRQHTYPPSLSGVIRLPGIRIDGSPVGLRFVLPATYPEATSPQLSVECSGHRNLHERLTAAVRQCAESAIGAESLLLAVEGLRDAIEALPEPQSNASLNPDSSTLQPALATASVEHHHIQHPAVVPAATAGQHTSTSSRSSVHTPATLLRVGIWFHHIKSTQKRKSIVSWARELNISGYAKPGYPGVILCEGRECDVQEYVQRIKALTWQAMQVRAEERLQLCSYNHGCDNHGDGCGNEFQPKASSTAGSSNLTGLSTTAAKPSGSCSRCSAVISNANKPMHTADAACAQGRGFQSPFQELSETGLSELGQLARDAGLEHLLLAVLKISK